MTDIREVLDEIQLRVDNPWQGIDVRSLLSALRKALEVHWESCSCDEREPCRDVRRIAEALDGAS